MPPLNGCAVDHWEFYSCSEAEKTSVLSAQVALLPPSGTAGNMPAASAWGVIPPPPGAAFMAKWSVAAKERKTYN